MATPNLDNMSLEQLEHIMNSQQDELAKLDAELAYIEQMENKMNEEQEQAPETMQEAVAPVAPVVPMDEFGMGLTPEAIQQATAKLVESGMFTSATGEMTPELVADLQVIADLLSPGLYDLSQPDQLEEFINGINDGTIPLTPIPAAGAGAVPAGIPVPAGGAAGVPGGLAGAGAVPAAGAGAAPAPIIR